jgi:hypothetical protein
LLLVGFPTAKQLDFFKNHIDNQEVMSIMALLTAKYGMNSQEINNLFKLKKVRPGAGLFSFIN